MYGNYVVHSTKGVFKNKYKSFYYDKLSKFNYTVNYTIGLNAKSSIVHEKETKIKYIIKTLFLSLGSHTHKKITTIYFNKVF